MSDKKDLNILIRDLPLHTDNLLNALAGIRRVSKWFIIREAMIEYAEKHKSDLPRFACDCHKDKNA